MKRALSDYEYEIVNQILIIELCFDACKELPIKAGMGDHFNCYFFNLNMSKGIASLQSLLDPTKREVSIKNYITEHKDSISKRAEYSNFIRETDAIKKEFKRVALNMRHKVVSHLDSGFKHSDFTSAYLLSDKLDDLIKITADLKTTFFKFANWAESSNHNRILQQLKLIIITFD
jgi:histidyl-tRNA synthetase